jgi:Restriction endonuclease
MSKKKSKTNQLAKQSLKSKPEDLPGISLEKTVARIQQMMDPNSVVTHNEKITDRFGIKRQFDVVIRGTFGGRPMLGVIECKDHSRKKGLEQIDAFANKIQNINANIKLIVSKKGFTKSALLLAEKEGIGCLSLAPDNPKLAGFSIGDMWFGRLYSWRFERMTIVFTKDKPQSGTFDVMGVKYNGKPVISYFEKELHTTHREETISGAHALVCKFSQTRIIEVDGVAYDVDAIGVDVTRICENKKKWISWSGDGFFDWHSGMFTIPPLGVINGSIFSSDITTWDDYDGEIPEPDKVQGLLLCVITGFRGWPPDAEAVGLSEL